MAKPTFQVALTAEQFNQMAIKLKSLGFSSQSLESGTLPKTKGVLLSYVVTGDPINQTQSVVTFTVEEKPFLITVGEIEGRIKGLIGVS